MLTAGDDAVGLEQLDEDMDDIALLKSRRFSGSMSAMSGADGRVYMEYRYADPIFSTFIALCVEDMKEVYFYLYCFTLSLLY